MDKRKLAPLALAVPFCLLAAMPAYAADTTTLQANLGPLNDSGASGTAMVEVEGTQVSVDIDSSGLVASAPHAQHFHIGGEHVCPTEEADEDGNGLISTAEGQPFYGPIKTSLTTEGDTSPDSALAVERMPAADDGGNVSYSRTIEVSEEVASQVKRGDAVIVQHGIDVNGNGEYDMEGAGKSELDPALPAEATNPATCGELMPAPEGGMAAGNGGAAAGGVNAGLLGLGAVLVAAAGGGVLVTRRLRGNR